MSVLGQMVAGAGSQLPIVGGLFEGYGKANAAETDFKHQKELMKLSEDMTLTNMEYNYWLNRQAERESPLDTMQGLKAAGINPAFAVGHLSSPVNSPSPAGPSGHSSPQSPLDIAALEQANAQVRLANAQADKLDAETDEIKASDSAIDNALKDVIGDAAWNNTDPAVQSFAKTLLAGAEKFKLGTIDGLNKFMDYMHNDRESLVHRLETEFKQRLWDSRLSGDLPELQTAKEVTEFETASQKLINLTLDTLLKTADVGRQEDVGQLVKAQLQKTLAEARKTHDTDLIALLEDGEKFDAFVKIFEGVLTAISAYGLVKAGGKLVAKGAEKVLSKGAEKVVAKEAAPVVEKIAVKEASPVVQKASKKIEASFADWNEYHKVKDDLARYYGSRNAENMFRYYTENRKKGDTFFKYLSDHGIMHPDKNGKISH